MSRYLTGSLVFTVPRDSPHWSVVHPQSPKMRLVLQFSPSQPLTCWSSRNRCSGSFCRTVDKERRRSRKGRCRTLQGSDPDRPRPHGPKMVWCPRKQLLRSPDPPGAPEHPMHPHWAEASPRVTTSSSLRTAPPRPLQPALWAYQLPRWLLWRDWEEKARSLKRKTPTPWRGRGVTTGKSALGWRRIWPHPQVHYWPWFIFLLLIHHVFWFAWIVGINRSFLKCRSSLFQYRALILICVCCIL